MRISFGRIQNTALALLLLGLMAPFASADTPSDVEHLDTRAFQIPISVQPSQKSEIRELQLFTSTDLGKTWEKSSAVGPDSDCFEFVAPTDGMYWFAVRVLKKDGAFEPRNLSAANHLKVEIKKAKPVSGKKGNKSVEELKARVEALQQELQQIQKRLEEIE